jgi:hypothetical protein
MSAGRHALLSSLLCALVCAPACRNAAEPFPAPQPASTTVARDAPPSDDIFSLRLDKATLRASGASEALIDRIGASAFRYFRALSEPFKHRTCEAFRDLRWRLPSGPVHGDAHLEQFAVTDKDYGLADFDNAGFGPAIVDLVRYAASLHLACRNVKGGCDAEQAVSAYFNAYRAALDHPVARKPPEIVARLRSRLGPEPEAWLQWADDLMQPLDPADEERVRSGWFRFVALMRETNPERLESFYRIRQLGSLEIGVGSAQEWKMLIRIAGDTDDPRDDVILEARNHSLPEYRGCVWRPTGGSLNVFLLTSMLDHPLPEVFGVLPNPGGIELPEIWIQSWDRGYRELSLSDVRDQTDLNALAADAGTQLAGHFWSTFPEPLRGHQRFTQLRAFEMTEQRARELARSLSREVVAEWSRFRGQAVQH